MSVEELVAAIDELSVLELNELVKAVEEKYGVSAAAGVVVAAAGGEIKVIKVVRDVTGLGLKEAKEAVEGAPKVLKEAVSKAEAEDIQKKFEEVGAKITLK